MFSEWSFQPSTSDLKIRPNYGFSQDRGMVDYIGSLGGVSNFKFSCLLAAITVLVYSNANFCDFVFDDVSAIKVERPIQCQ